MNRNEVIEAMAKADYENDMGEALEWMWGWDGLPQRHKDYYFQAAKCKLKGGDA